MEKEPLWDVAGRDPSPYETYASPEEVRRLLARERFERITNLTRHLLDTTISIYGSDPEWDVFDASLELEQSNGLPEGISAQDIMDCYYRVFHHEE